MTKDELIDESEIRRFLLGEMSEDDRRAFEDQFIADQVVFENVRVVEDELIESYIRGTLPAPDVIKFEQTFLTTERRSQRVAFTRTMLGALGTQKNIAVVAPTITQSSAPTLWESIVGFFKPPTFAYGAALVIVIATFGGWFFLRNLKNQEIARQSAPIPTSETGQPSQNSTPNSNLKPLVEIETNQNNSGQTNETPNGNSNTQNNESAANPVLALFAGTVRSGGKTNELHLPESATNVFLQLNLESQDYKNYQAEIVTANGELVLKNQRLQAKNSKINFSVPARKLTRGDYIVRLSARTPQNEIESIADYTFRINR